MILLSCLYCTRSLYGVCCLVKGASEGSFICDQCLERKAYLNRPKCSECHRNVSPLLQKCYDSVQMLKCTPTSNFREDHIISTSQGRADMTTRQKLIAPSQQKGQKLTHNNTFNPTLFTNPQPQRQIRDHGILSHQKSHSILRTTPSFPSPGGQWSQVKDARNNSFDLTSEDIEEANRALEDGTFIEANLLMQRQKITRNCAGNEWRETHNAMAVANNYLESFRKQTKKTPKAHQWQEQSPF